MQRIFTIAALALSALLLMASAASAVIGTADYDFAPSGTHLAKGSSLPDCTIISATDSVSCTGATFGGVGNTNATTSLVVRASATVLCHNPGKNSKIVEPHTTTATGSTTPKIARPSRNGQIVIAPESKQITTADVEEQFVCPNPNWTEEVTDVTVTGFTYTITFQGFDTPFYVINVV